MAPIGPFVLVGALNFAKLLRLALSAVDRLRDRPRVIVLPRALDAPARERGKRP